MIRKKEKSIQQKLTFLGRSYRNYDREGFQENLANSDWNGFYTAQDVDQAWEYLQKTIKKEIDLMCPLKNIKIRKVKDPWITNDILELINDKNDLVHIAKRTHLKEDWQATRIARNLVASIVKDAKRDYLRNELDNNVDPNKFWKRLHHMFPDKPTTGKIRLKDSITNEKIEEHAIPNCANSFFHPNWFYHQFTWLLNLSLRTAQIPK